MPVVQSRVGVLALVLVGACARHAIVPGGEWGEGCVHAKADSVALRLNRDVDILFVIDNSGSMAEEQESLAADIESLTAVLEEGDLAANYRIGITTTDNDNPWCPETTPEGGALQLASCLSRLAEFVQADTGADQTAACTNVCGLDHIEISPTTTAEDDDPAPRPWVEHVEGATNLPADVSTAAALACFLPQGVAGCGFESQLESMYKGLKRAQESSELSFGFLREDAVLAVVVVSDEADCSYRVEHDSIFMPDENRVFWSDPEADQPTSAVCWNAGVACTGGPGTYDECHAEDRAENGSPAGPEEAVLHPLGRYTGLLQELEDRKKERQPWQEVLVAVIGGVPEGYAGGGQMVYQDAEEQGLQDEFGIGPGCESAAGVAVPPVRMLEFADAFAVGERRNVHSICAESHAEALDAIARGIRGQIRPACMPACVGDSDCDPSNGLTPSCVLIQEVPGEIGPASTMIPECEVDVDAGTWGFSDAEDDACFRMLTENDTPSERDDISSRCLDEGWNLEFVIERRSGTPAPPGTVVRAACDLSMNRPEDCPGMWGAGSAAALAGTTGSATAIAHAHTRRIGPPMGS